MTDPLIFVASWFAVGVIAGLVYALYKVMAPLALFLVVCVCAGFATAAISQRIAPWYVAIPLCGVAAGVLCIPFALVEDIRELRAKSREGDSHVHRGEE
jgi:hypothetical protein